MVDVLTTAQAPRRYSPGAGLPGDRGARTAARRSFVALKQTFLAALADTVDADWLLEQVRRSEEPVDLWLLRAPVFAVLGGADSERRQRRQMVRRGLDSVFPELDPRSAFIPF